MSARDVISNLRELAALTATADGAQRLAWGPVWREARQWFNGKLATLGITPEIAAAGALMITEVEHLIDRTGTRLAWREHGVELARMHESQAFLKAIDAVAYLKLHIEQGPVLEAMNQPTGVMRSSPRPKARSPSATSPTVTPRRPPGWCAPSARSGPSPALSLPCRACARSHSLSARWTRRCWPRCWIGQGCGVVHRGGS